MIGIKFIRQVILDISPVQFSRKLGVSKMAISEWESGHNLISEKNKEKIYSITKINPIWYSKELTKVDMITILLECK